jgi:hypothetical protein
VNSSRTQAAREVMIRDVTAHCAQSKQRPVRALLEAARLFDSGQQVSIGLEDPSTAIAPGGSLPTLCAALRAVG